VMRAQKVTTLRHPNAQHQLNAHRVAHGKKA